MVTLPRTANNLNTTNAFNHQPMLPYNQYVLMTGNLQVIRTIFTFNTLQYLAFVSGYFF